MLNIKMVKPKPKQYKIAFASLNYNKKRIATVKRSQLNTSTKPKDEFDIIIDNAILKGLVTEADREIKKTELSLFTKEELEKYKQYIQQADSIEFITETDINNDEMIKATINNDEISPEEMLARIKGTEGTIGDFSKLDYTNSDIDDAMGSNNQQSRSLADLKAERAYQREVQIATAQNGEKASYTTAEDISTSFLEQSLAQLKIQRNASSDVNNGSVNNDNGEMSNFKGLTKPIIQPPSNTSSNPMVDLMNNITWSMGPR